MASKLVIIRGNSGSGKTTVAKALQQELGHNTMLLSQDVIRREILRVKDGPNTEAISLLRELLIYGSRHCNVVILEGILYANWYHSLFELAIELFDNIHPYYYDLPFEETLSRYHTKPNSGEFGEMEMRRWWQEKDFVDILTEKILTAEVSIQETVSMIYKDIMQ